MNSTEMLKGHLDLLLLATLRTGPAHGYAIIEDVRRRSLGTFDLPEGTVYPALHRLEQAGLLASCWSSEAGRRRRVYDLSAIARFGAPEEVARQFAPVLAASRARAVGRAQVVALAAVLGAMLVRDPFVPTAARSDGTAPLMLSLASVGATWAFVCASALGLWTLWRSRQARRDPLLPFSAARAILTAATLSRAALVVSVGADTLASVQWAAAGHETQTLSIRLISVIIQCAACGVGFRLVHRARADVAALAAVGSSNGSNGT